MLWIRNTIISEDLITQAFVCDLQACKGACCWEGDSGAPLDEAELPLIRRLLPQVLPFLSEAARNRIQSIGPYEHYSKHSEYGTSLMEDGACVFLVREGDSIGQCAFELAWKSGKIPFRKPLSCQLYPIRVTRDPNTGLDLLNYDRWEICKPACKLGKASGVPVYRFLREALIRAYGPDYYEELEQAAIHLLGETKTKNPS